LKIPFVIDNREHKLAEILNELLEHFQHRSLDIASAYFNVHGFRLIQKGLENIGSFRLLLGTEPGAGEDIGMKPRGDVLARQLRGDLEAEPFNEATLRLVEDLIAFLRQDSVEIRVVDKGFLHAKCYLLYGDKPSGQGFLFDRFQPLLGIVGSSNFTGAGLTSNRELNLCHRVLLDTDEAKDDDSTSMVSFLSDEKASIKITEKNRQLLKSEVGARAILDLVNWYNTEWEESRDFKDELIEILDASKFGQKEYTPYQVYMKALYEYFRDDLEGVEEAPGRSAVELSQFQEDAVKKARRVIAKYSGVMVADSVGLGKTWIGKKLLEEYAYHQREKALVICPAQLRDMWDTELKQASIAADIISQELLGQQDFDYRKYGDADVILIDESHNFRSRGAQRYDNLSGLISYNGGRGKHGTRKKVIMLTATPINNDLMDLYHQILFITHGDPAYFSAAGIGDLHRYFLQARREFHDGDLGIGLFNLLEEVVIRRTRPHIKKAYPEATINGKKIFFPDRKLKTEQYDLEAVYSGIYDYIVSGIENLNLAPYKLETYKKTGGDEMEIGREQALVGIFKSRYLKRFESSIEAFRISIKRALAFQKTFEEYILDGKVLSSAEFHKAMSHISREDEESDVLPRSIADDIDENAEAREILAEMKQVDPSGYDLKQLHKDVQADIDVLTDIYYKIKDITSDKDSKLKRLADVLAGSLRGKKVLIFTYYRDTARYLHRWFQSDEGKKFLESIGNPTLRRLDGGTQTKDRRSVIEKFAPKANNREDIKGTDDEIDILISTDVLSEGQNLQDCAHLINYDLHWNPTRMVQRAGRIDRIGTEFDTLFIHNMFPDRGLERLLGLVESLTRKISYIDASGFLDASVLGETVHPRNFNTLRRIKDEDETVVEEEEQITELVSSEALLQHLKEFLGSEGLEKLSELPDGIHSGLIKPKAKGMFFYFKTKAKQGHNVEHFWRYYDLNTGKIEDNRYLIADYIRCDPDTPRVVADYDVFDIHDKIVGNILEASQDAVSMEAAPTKVAPVQTNIATVLQSLMNNPDIDRKQVMEALKFLKEPMFGGLIKRLRATYKEYQDDSDYKKLLEAILGMQQEFGFKDMSEVVTKKKFSEEDLELICFDYLCS